MNALARPNRDSPIRVVVADDHPVVRRMVRSALQQHPKFEVCGEAENGAEAIEEVKRARPDVVVLNITNAPGQWVPSRTRDQKADTGDCNCYFVVSCGQTLRGGGKKDWCAGICPEIKNRRSPHRSRRVCNERPRICPVRATGVAESLGSIHKQVRRSRAKLLQNPSVERVLRRDRICLEKPHIDRR